jgi:hypothetical protein
MADMQDGNETGILSIKELNNVLNELEIYRKDKKTAYEQYTINENKLTKIDIAYIAGLILYNKQYGTKFLFDYQGDIVERINTINEETGEIKEVMKERIWEIRQYFKQYEKLYATKWSDVFTRFKGITDESVEKVDLWSFSFAPILLINNETLSYFFGNGSKNVNDLKNKYIEGLLNSYVQNMEEKKYLKSSDNIIERLRNSSPIHTFVFSVSYNKIKPFVNKYGETKKSQVEKVKLVKQLWEFTQQYVRCLYELAKNIVEHSGQGENDGQGMITIRAYSENDMDKMKVLETHVFDYGTLGIIPKLKEYTEKQKKEYEKKEYENEKLSENQIKVKNAYTEDFEKHLNKNFKLTDFIQGNNLVQQTFRHIGHYGINKLYNLIQHPLEGDMFIASKGINGKQEYFNEKVENPTLKMGTHYFIAIPFISKNFKKIDLSADKRQEFFTLGSSKRLKELISKEIRSIKLDELNKENLDNFTGILNITVCQKLDKQFVNNIDSYFTKLLKYGKEFIVALNLENVLDEDSNLLRFLGYLTFEYEQSFIVYNLEFKTYKKMIDDNKVFANTRGWEDFWHRENAILVYSKIYLKNKNKNFYFADILYGRSSNDYYSINKLLSHTFHNTVSIVDEEARNIKPANNVNLLDFFNNSALLPYDIFLKSEEKELAFFNIELILQNELSTSKKNYDDTDVYNPVKRLEHYIDNFDGYCIKNTHFKIGNKVHSTVFYYAKQLFQNSFYSVRLAIYLVKKIDSNIQKCVKRIEGTIIKEINDIHHSNITVADLIEKINNLNDMEKKYITKITEEIKIKKQEIDEHITRYKIDSSQKNSIFQGITLAEHLREDISTIVKQVCVEPITLIGYDMYSELILSLIENFLNDVYEYKVNHFVARNEDNKLTFLPKDSFEYYLNEYNNRKTIIIVPIAATGSTAKKIEKNIRDQIYRREKKIKKDEDEARKLANDYEFIKPYYNIIWAKSEEKKFIEKKYIETENQTSIISLTPAWHEMKNCSLCYEGIDKDSNIKTKPLFDTDNSSLTPALIFEKPMGQTRLVGNEISSIVEFDQINFDTTINYQSVSRNDNYRIYDIESDLFIKKNDVLIKKWLECIKKCLENPEELKKRIKKYFRKQINLIEKEQIEDFINNYELKIDEKDLVEEIWFKRFCYLYKKDKNTACRQWLKAVLKILKTPFFSQPTDKAVIVAPCHESNSRFINLVNEYVFSSAATIIHLQNGVDFIENFSLLNKGCLTEDNTKIFYVDDSLITGNTFFELFDLMKGVTNNELPLTASILLNDQAVPFIHDQVAKLSNTYFAFTTFNQSPTFSIIGKNPLEYEQKRYEQMIPYSLHDALIGAFHKKANKLNPEKRKEEEETYAKRIRRLKMFEATHKIYDYFTTHGEIESIEDFIDFRLEYGTDKNCVINDHDTNQKALLKVLSQYPFVLYEKLRTKTFDWHKKLLNEIPEPEEDFDMERDYDNSFSTFKFLLRRATFLNNYQVLGETFLKKLSRWFIKIDNYFKGKEKENLCKEEEKLCNFPIFVLGCYTEMIQSNGWVAYHILEKFKLIEKIFEKSIQGKQFLRMMKIEAASVVDNFMEMIEKDYRFDWRDMFRYTEEEEQKTGSQRKFNETLITETKRIVRFLDIHDKEQGLLKTNKFLIIRDALLGDSDSWRKEDTPFVKYLWIKQLLYSDCKDNKSHLPKKIDYQEKIDAILDKMKGFFPNEENLRVFFIVTDGQEKPYILKDEQNLLCNFYEEFDIDKQIRDLDKDIKTLEQKGDIIYEEKADFEKKKVNKKKLEVEQQNNKTQTIITFLNGKLSNIKNAPKTTVEFAYIDNNWKNLYDDKDEDLKFMPKDSTYKWLYLIRISKLREDEGKNCEFESQGLLGFYSTKDLKDNFLSKQLLMLLRKDMSAFINKHHKNDEFAGLVLEKEKENFSKIIRHGIEEYEESIKIYFNRICNMIPNKDNDDNYKQLREYYLFALSHLTKKIHLMQTLSKIDPNNPECFQRHKIEEVINTFKMNFHLIMKFKRSKLTYFSENNNLDDFIEINYKPNNDRPKVYKELLQEDFDFPKDFLRELIFELIFNIRKYGFNFNSGVIIEEDHNKLRITVDLKEKNNIIYFVVSNNYCYFDTEEDSINRKIKKYALDGLNLINNVLIRAKIGELLVTIDESPELRNRIINIFIPLKKRNSYE